MIRERDWLWAAAAYLIAFLNLGYILKEVVGGFLDPLIAAGLTVVVGILCIFLGIRYLLLKTKVEVPNDLSLVVKERRRQSLAIAFTPVLICVVMLVVFVLFGKSNLLAPADLRPTDGRAYSISGGQHGYDENGQGYDYDYCQNVHSMTPAQLAQFAAGNYGVDFRLFKRPTVKVAQITAVRLTVQSVTEAPTIVVPEAPAVEEPLVWVVEIPENVAPGIVIDGQLLKFRDTENGRVAEFTDGLPTLPNDYPIPCRVKITCKKECLIHYKLEVRTDAGWRSAPIDICDEQPVAFYKPGSKKLVYLNGAARPDADDSEVPPAPPADGTAPVPTDKLPATPPPAPAA